MITFLHAMMGFKLKKRWLATKRPGPGVDPALLNDLLSKLDVDTIEGSAVLRVTDKKYRATLAEEHQERVVESVTAGMQVEIGAEALFDALRRNDAKYLFLINFSEVGARDQGWGGVVNARGLITGLMRLDSTEPTQEWH